MRAARTGKARKKAHVSTKHIKALKGYIYSISYALPLVVAAWLHGLKSQSLLDWLAFAIRTHAPHFKFWSHPHTNFLYFLLLCTFTLHAARALRSVDKNIVSLPCRVPFTDVLDTLYHLPRSFTTVDAPASGTQTHNSFQHYITGQGSIVEELIS